MTNKIIWAIIPARSGSKGLPGKNIRKLAGKPLIAHAIDFANEVGIFEKVLLSTDSREYAEIGKRFGAWVPFLRDKSAALDNSMEEHILEDLDNKLTDHKIQKPDILVWLRPTFPFRSKNDLIAAVKMLTDEIDSVRLVTEGEPRLYEIVDDFLTPRFSDGGRSMVRRQEFPTTYKVFHTDIFWYRNIRLKEKFIGSRIRALPIHRLCAMDVDGIEDFEIIEALIHSQSKILRQYVNSSLIY